METTETPETPRLPRHRWHVVAAGIAVVTLAGAGIAYASIPGPDAIIHGCYKTSTGALRVVDSATADCGKGEQAIQWNQAGPQGVPGAVGGVGPAGPTGADGGLSGHEIREGFEDTIDPNALTRVEALCLGGQVVVGGGFYTNSPSANAFQDMPLDNGGNGWQVRIYNPTSNPVTVQAYALCVNGS